MKKNVASQIIGAQLVNATTGAAFTSAVTVYVTGDGGTQAVGSVSSGACTHEGNGFHTYAPAQAETNYDHIGFTFIGTGAVPATVQVYPTFPQTGDNFARLGAPAGASVSADVAAIKAETVTILADTNDIQTRLPAALVGGRIDANVGAISGDATAADNAEAFFDGTGYAGTGNTIPTVTTLTNLPAITANWLTAAGTAADFGAEVADAVWDEAIAGHAGAGSTGEALSAAGAAGDPWITALPGSYSSGQAGYIVGTNLNATVSSRASQTSLDTVDDFLDTEIAAIKTKTDFLPSATAGASGGLFIAGTNAATTITTALTTTFTGSLTGSVASVTGAVGSVTGLTAATVHSDLDDIQARLPAALVSGRMDSSVGAMAANTITAAASAADFLAEVNAEVVDALATDTYAEPGQGTPAATTTLAAKINYLYKAWRNKNTQTATTFSLFADDASTVDQKATVSDDGTTYTRGEIATGP